MANGKDIFNDVQGIRHLCEMAEDYLEKSQPSVEDKLEAAFFVLDQVREIAVKLGAIV